MAAATTARRVRRLHRRDRSGRMRRSKGELPEPSYALLDTERDGMPAVVVINEALNRFQYRDAFPWHLTITIEARRLAKNGMPTRAESAILDALGENIEAALDARKTKLGATNVLFLARVTCNGERELMFRVHDPAVVDVELKRLISSGAEREWRYEMSGDDDWEGAAAFFELLAAARV